MFMASLCLSYPPSASLPVEHLRGQPLCMELYPLLFSSCRIPGPKHDHVVHYSQARRPPTHITVVRNFQVNLLAPELSDCVYFILYIYINSLLVFFFFFFLNLNKYLDGLFSFSISLAFFVPYLLELDGS